jgi:hypothetical protein
VQVFWAGSMAPAAFPVPSAVDQAARRSRLQASDRLGKGSREREVGEGAGGSLELMLILSAAQARDFVARLSRETCVARQHRRQAGALSYYACSSCIARQASPFEPGLSCCAGFWAGSMAPAPLPLSPSAFPFRFPLPLSPSAFPFRFPLPQRRLKSRSPAKAAGATKPRAESRQPLPRRASSGA